jgi:S-adenosylmethionine synthetase
MRPRILTSESVTEGHSDKLADAISDAVVDHFLAIDPRARVACETMIKCQLVSLAAEITCTGVDVDEVDYTGIVRRVVFDAGYNNPLGAYRTRDFIALPLVTAQAEEIAGAVIGRDDGDLGAGDQGIMFGYATDETPELMPLPIVLAHRLTRALADDRRSGAAPWLRPDGKAQVSVAYDDGRPTGVAHVLVSTQHADGALEAVRNHVARNLVPRALGDWLTGDTVVAVNPAGEWTIGGPAADAGVTGRKIMVDTYGGLARHGGGAFSGKDPTKVDRSGAYFCRWLARQVVRQGMARRAEIQVAYAIGQPRSVALAVDTFGTGDDAAAADFLAGFDFRPRAIIERLDLARPIYRQTTNYGHFGRSGLTWEGEE